MERFLQDCQGRGMSLRSPASFIALFFVLSSFYEYLVYEGRSGWKSTSARAVSGIF